MPISHRSPHLARPRAARSVRARGVATLTVVMVLFFVMALVAAYTNRNLVFEQRISVSTYRVARAAEAAEAAQHWTLGLLNGGRIDTQCQPSTTASDLDYRSKAFTWLVANTYGEGGYGLPSGSVSRTELVSGCMIADADGSLSCTCPTTAVQNPTITRPSDGKGVAFHTSIFLPNNLILPGTVGLASYGCGSVGSGTDDCSRSVATSPQVDGVAGVTVVLGLLRAMPLAPKATLTVGGVVNASGAILVSNPDAGSGFTVMTGRPISNRANVQFAVPAGSTGEGALESVVALSDLAPAALLDAPNPTWYRTFFGMPQATYEAQPAARLINCAAGCTQADLTPVLAGYPRNPIILNGNVTLSNTAALGDSSNPVMLVVNGLLTVSGTAPIVGFVHADSVSWTAASAVLQGALVTSGNFTASGTARLRYDRDVMDLIRLRYGSFVRVPGSWNTRNDYR